MLGSAVQKAQIVSVMYLRLYTGAVFNVYVLEKAKTALFSTPSRSLLPATLPQ